MKCEEKKKRRRMNIKIFEISGKTEGRKVFRDFEIVKPIQAFSERKVEISDYGT